MTLYDFQLSVLSLGSAICFLIALFSLVIEYKSKVRKVTLFIIEFSTSLLLIADKFAYLYRGDLSQKGYYIVRIANFLTFFLVYVLLVGLNRFIGSYTKMSKNKRRRSFRLLNYISYAGMLLLIISQFTGWYYYFDENNKYTRGSLFLISFIMPLIIIVFTFITILKIRKEIPVLIFAASIVYSVLPLSGAIIQVFLYGTSLFNILIGVSAITIFALVLIDQNEFLRVTATTDKLTGLWNSYGFHNELEKICAAKKSIYYDAFYFDIVRMGVINSKYGNSVGDFVLKKYAHIIKHWLQKDEVFGRLGGDFFVAFVKREHSDNFLKLLSAVEIPLEEVGRKNIKLSAIVGIYQVIEDSTTADQIVTYVSAAANFAKNVKKKPYFYLTKEVMNELDEQSRMIESLPEYMENREFVPFYQPKVNLESNTLCGAEALCRWNHDGGFVPPYKFIPLLEESDNICPFDFYMLNRVCEDIRTWLNKGLKVPTISVNFSRKNLGNPILAEEIYNVVKSYDIPLSLVQIEITETIDQYPLDYLKGVVEALQRYGLSAAIDDFGVGSSSIRLLKEVPFDVLKIDKSFVDSLTTKDCKFLKHIIGMAEEAGASVIAEGVEKKDQVEVLRNLGCHEIQGYFFDKPLEEEDFEKRLYSPVYAYD